MLVNFDAQNLLVSSFTKLGVVQVQIRDVYLHDGAFELYPSVVAWFSLYLVP